MKVHKEWKKFISFRDGHQIYTSKVCGFICMKLNCTFCQVRDRSFSYLLHTFKQVGVFNDQYGALRAWVACLLAYLLTYFVALVRKQTIPTERPPLAGKVSANFCG
jgi:hypothetical protein